MNKDNRIFVAGASGMVGSAIVRKLKELGYTKILTNRINLINQVDVELEFDSIRPDYVFLCAARVGGIHANNTYRGEFIYNNLMIQTNVIESCHRFNVSKLLFMGSSCIYPKNAPQPLKEEYLLTGELEQTNSPYAVAKIAGIEMCKAYRDQYGCNFISVMPTNLYGPGDNYDLENSHVIPALIRKFYEAKRDVTDVTIWGTGNCYREFMHVDDLASASVFLMNNYEEREHINVGTGEEIKIKDLVELIKKISNFTRNVVWDTSKPDGTYRKTLDCDKLNLKYGWGDVRSLEQGLKQVYDRYSSESQD